jgi:hypothetical protein
VTIQLYAAKGNPAGAGQVPGSYLQSVVTINDIGGFAQAFPITILPAPGETISGGTSFILGANYALVTLLSDVLNGGWTAVNNVSGAALTDGPNDGFNYGRQSGVWTRAVPLGGGTMTGALVLNADPAVALGAATKQYADTKVAKSGDTMTGLLTLSANPTAALGAATKQYVDTRLPRSYLAGLTLSTPGASTTFSVAPGVTVDSTDVDMMTITTSWSKSTAAWVVGNGTGGFDGGTSFSPSTWYHVYVIKRPDTGVVDVAFSASASAPTTGGNIPAAYTLFRRIGAMKTNGSSQWTAFTQNGDEFLWLTPINDANGVASGLGTTARVLTVPTGVQVWAKFIGLMGYTSASVLAVFSPLDMGTQTPGTPVGFYHLSVSSNQSLGVMDLTVRTSTSASVNIALSAAGSIYYIATYGWIDRRGRDL